MHTSKIGDLNFGKFKTEVEATEEVRKVFKSKKESEASLIPPAWLWYDNELLEIIDENGDGKPDDKFGTSFKIIYMLEKENMNELEQKSILLSKTTIKNIKLKYAAIKIAEEKKPIQRRMPIRKR